MTPYPTNEDMSRTIERQAAKLAEMQRTIDEQAREIERLRDCIQVAFGAIESEDDKYAAYGYLLAEVNR